MRTEVCYFSGTGNSLAVAQDIACKTGGTLHAIPVLMRQERITPQADVLVLVFPVYNKGIPLILKRFVDKLDGLKDMALYTVCTYGDTPGLAIRHLVKLVQARGGNLAAGFGVHMPYNYLTPSWKIKGFFSAFTLREIPPEKQRALLDAVPARVEQIVAYLHAGKSGDLEITSDLLTRLADRLNLNETLAKLVWLKVAGVIEPTDLPYLESRQLMDQAFHADEHCIGCGTCARICPVANICIVEGKPQWQHHCEQCFACLQWCPQTAIQFGQHTIGKRRYHHPDVKVLDMLRSAPSSVNS